MLNFNVLGKENGGLMNESGSQFRYKSYAVKDLIISGELFNEN